MLNKLSHRSRFRVTLPLILKRIHPDLFRNESDDKVKLNETCVKNLIVLWRKLEIVEDISIKFIKDKEKGQTGNILMLPTSMKLEDSYKLSCFTKYNPSSIIKNNDSSENDDIFEIKKVDYKFHVPQEYVSKVSVKSLNRATNCLNIVYDQLTIFLNACKIKHDYILLHDHDDINDNDNTNTNTNDGRDRRRRRNNHNHNRNKRRSDDDNDNDDTGLGLGKMNGLDIMKVVNEHARDQKVKMSLGKRRLDAVKDAYVAASGYGHHADLSDVEIDQLIYSESVMCIGLSLDEEIIALKNLHSFFVTYKDLLYEDGYTWWNVIFIIEKDNKTLKVEQVKNNVFIVRLAPKFRHREFLNFLMSLIIDLKKVIPKQ